MTERAGNRAGAGPGTGTGIATSILASAQLVLLTLTVLARADHTVPGGSGSSYAIAMVCLIGLAAGAAAAVARPTDWTSRAVRLWYGPVTFVLLVGATGLGPVTDRPWLAVPLIGLGAGVVLAAAADVLVTATRRVTGAGPLRSARAMVVGGLIGLAGAGVVISQGTQPLIWAVLVVVGYATTAAVAGLDLRPWSVALLLVPVIVTGPATMDDAAIRTPASSLHVAPTLTGTADVVIDNVPAGDIRDAWSWERNNPYVGAPYAGQRTFDRILVLDAGYGNAVGRALAAEPSRVDAVEADHGLVSAARRFRPDRAFDDSRVTVHEQDPRAALRRLRKPYDLVVVARADPRLLTSSTMDRIRDLLTPTGIYAVHDDGDDHLEAAVAAARTTFGHQPCVEDATGGFAVFAGVDPDRQSCTGTPIAGEPLTDNRPFTATESVRMLLIAGCAAVLLVVLLVVLFGLGRLTSTGSRPGFARRFVAPALVGTTAALHAVAAAPVLRDLPIDDWAVPPVLLTGWLCCLLPALARPVRARPAVAIAMLLAITLFVLAVVPTGSTSFAGVVPRLAAVAVMVGLPIALGAVLLAGAASAGHTEELLAGVAVGLAVGLTVAGVVGVIGYAGLFVVAALPALGYAAIAVVRRPAAQELSTVE